MITSEKIDAVLPALAKVKTVLQAVTKSANNPFFKSKYADLNTYLDEVEPLLKENGLLLLQPVVDGPSNVVVSRIYHVESGQFIQSSMKLVGDVDMQKSGSGVTYARRYTLGSLLSMKAEDDDGNSAVGKTSAPKAGRVLLNNEVKETPAPVQTTTPTPTPAESKLMANRPSFRDRNKNKTTETPKTTTIPEVVSNGDDL